MGQLIRWVQIGTNPNETQRLCVALKMVSDVEMDSTVTIQRTKLGGVPPKPIGVLWWTNDDVVNGRVLLIGSEYGP